jgi:3-oxoacyl-(acyl-carrier-protein) synthase
MVVIRQACAVLPSGVYDAAGLHALLCEGRGFLAPCPDLGIPHPVMASPRRDGITASGMALQVLDALHPPQADALVIGTTKGEHTAWLENRQGPPGPELLLQVLNAASPLPGLRFTVSNACASGAQAAIEAAELIQDGEAGHALALGVDALTPFVAQGFASLEAVSGAGARPFDAARDGLSPGEAAAGVLLAPDGPGARILAWGCSNDANHISGPSRDGSGLALAITRALRGIDPSRVRAICAHGTGTRYNDAMEAKAFRAVFGDPPPVFGVKGALGHTMGAAGMLELMLSAEVARTGVVPPTTGCSQIAEDCPLGVVIDRPREVGAGLVLSTNSGFGGMNTAVLVEGGRA